MDFAYYISYHIFSGLLTLRRGKQLSFIYCYLKRIFSSGVFTHWPNHHFPGLFTWCYNCFTHRYSIFFSYLLQLVGTGSHRRIFNIRKPSHQHFNGPHIPYGESFRISFNPLIDFCCVILETT